MQGFLYLRKFIVVCCCLLAICPSSFGGNIKGHVYGKNNSEQLIGVTIILNPSHTKTTSAWMEASLLKTLKMGCTLCNYPMLVTKP